MMVMTFFVYICNIHVYPVHGTTHQITRQSFCWLLKYEGKCVPCFPLLSSWFPFFWLACAPLNQSIINIKTMHNFAAFSVATKLHLLQSKHYGKKFTQKQFILLKFGHVMWYGLWWQCRKQYKNSEIMRYRELFHHHLFENWGRERGREKKREGEIQKRAICRTQSMFFLSVALQDKIPFWYTFLPNECDGCCYKFIPFSGVGHVFHVDIVLVCWQYTDDFYVKREHIVATLTFHPFFTICNQF